MILEWNIKVETYSGYKADEYPVRFWIGEERLEILEIEDRWYSPGFTYFKVFADNARHYILKWSTDDDRWTAKEIN
ncbi:MAG TPA: hypothetical protein PLE24_16265 [Chitinispirillaceae bacterium]|jgi:hypothetical protein|nr:hypothetical protein [Chitinispirillaceae bacterium]